MVETFGEKAKRISELFKQADEKKKELDLSYETVASEMGLKNRRKPPFAQTARKITIVCFLFVLFRIIWGV